MTKYLETARLHALQQLHLLDTPPSEAFDRITRMAAKLFDLPIAAVSLTDQDRQWFKSRIGIIHASIPRDGAPCAEVAVTTTALVVPDLLAHPGYRDSVLARSGVRFYAGAPLTTRDGFGLGAMCVLGMEPRDVSDAELVSLVDLAALAMTQIDLQHAVGRIDPVTGMPNRIQFIEDLEDLAKDQPGNEQRFAVLVDVASPEQVSSIVGVMGATYFDRMILDAADTIRSLIGRTRRAFHIAATQFAFLAPPGVEAESYVRRRTDVLHGIRSVADSRFVSTTTIGVVAFQAGGVQPVDLLRMAHCAALDARRRDARVSVYCPTQEAQHQRRFLLLDNFGRTLETGDRLRLVYQPRIDLASGICCGAEALLRWSHPTLGDIPPGELIPVIEQTALIKATTAWVLDAALSQLARWHANGHGLQISVNVSTANLLEADFADRVAEALSRHCVPPGLLELEVTETFMMEDADRAISTLKALARAGVRLAIDDFGTGYSNLSYLMRLPVHKIKIDQSFASNLVGNNVKLSVIRAIISVAHDLGHRVVAEGVETREVLELVAGESCDEAQGYLFGRPMEAEDFVHWLQDRAATGLEGVAA